MSESALGLSLGLGGRRRTQYVASLSLGHVIRPSTLATLMPRRPHRVHVLPIRQPGIPLYAANDIVWREREREREREEREREGGRRS